MGTLRSSDQCDTTPRTIGKEKSLGQACKPTKILCPRRTTIPNSAWPTIILAMVMEASSNNTLLARTLHSMERFQLLLKLRGLSIELHMGTRLVVSLINRSMKTEWTCSHRKPHLTASKTAVASYKTINLRLLPSNNSHQDSSSLIATRNRGTLGPTRSIKTCSILQVMFPTWVRHRWWGWTIVSLVDRRHLMSSLSR